MAKSNTMQSGLDAILGNGVSAEAKETSNNVSVCFRCSPERIAKIRAIANMKRVSLKVVMESAIDLAIERFEAKNGAIIIEEETESGSIFD